MNIDLNFHRNVIEIRLDPEDEVAPKTIQQTLHSAAIEFKTLDWRGRWQIPARFVVNLAEAFEPFDPLWTPRALERLNLTRQDEVLNRIDSDMYSPRDHKLIHAAELKVQPFEEQSEAAQLMSAPSVRRFALFWKPGTGKTGAMITAGHE